MSLTSIRKITIITVALAATVGLVEVSACKAQESTLQYTAAAIKEASGAVDDLLKLQGAAADAVAGKTPSMETDWSRLADEYDKAAAKALAAPLPSMPIDNVVSFGQLFQCGTRQSSQSSMNKYLGDLRSIRDKEQDVISQIDVQLANLKNARKALEYLIGIHERLMAMPTISNKFAFDWLDLNTRVSESLSKLETAFGFQRNRFVSDLTVLDTKIKNYEWNLSLVFSLPACKVSNPPSDLSSVVN